MSAVMKFFPIAKKWEVGKTYKVEMEIKMTGISIARFQNDSEFDITGFGVKSSIHSTKAPEYDDD